MDIAIILLNLLAIGLAYIVMKQCGATCESILLLSFFTTTSFISFHLFNTEAYVLWPMIFASIIVVFGLLSFNHVVVLGYVAHMVIVGMHMKFELPGYSFFIYAIFLFQLLAVRYGHTFSYYRDLFSGSSHAKTLAKES